MNKSFLHQLIYGIGFLLGILIITFTYFSIKNQSDFLYAEGLEQAQNRSLALAASSKTWIMSNDYIGLEEVVENFSNYADLVFSAVINMDSKIIAHTDKTLIGKFIADKERLLFLNNSKYVTSHNEETEKLIIKNIKYIDIIRVVHNNDQHIGFVHLRINQEARQARIDNTIRQGVTFTIISVLIGILFAYVIANGLIKELLKLIQTIKKLGRGQRDIRADESGLKEIAELSHEFNDLITTLNKSEKSNEDLRERLELAFVGSKDGLWDWNIEDDIIYFSPLWKSMLGYTDDELSNVFLTWQNRVHPEDLEKTLNDIQDHINAKTELYINIHRLKHKDGSWVWILDRGKALFNEAGKAIRMVGTHTDITKDKESQLKHKQRAQMIEQTHDSVISTDLDGYINSWNYGSTLIFGYDLDEVLGKHISILHRQKDMIDFAKSLEQLKATGEYKADTYLVKKSKEIISVALSLSILRDENGNATHMVGYAQDITQRKIAEEKLLEQKHILDYQAHHDSLTNLPNRLLFQDRLTQSIQKAKRNKSKVALLFIDLDHFKEINDSLGHDIGDKILKSVTTRLNDVIRDEDTLARLGGDEFIIIMEDLISPQDVSPLAQKILNILSKEFIIDGNTLYISSSIGVSIYPDDGLNTQNLLKYADAAMYKAKDEGRNNFQYYSSEMTELAFERVVMEANFRKSLKNEDFIVYYQPQVDGTTNKLIGMEALVRWNHPTMGIVSPAKFIPLAEATGLIIELDKYVMKTAMSQISSWYAQGLNPGILAMNLAVKQLQQKDFINMFESLMKETTCRADWLELEVTEGQIMTNPEEAIKILYAINSIGVELAVDDFGTGYSSLAYLKKLPIDKLKIDQAFVRDLPNDEEDAAIAKAVIALSKSLNLRVIAEGVETKEQKDFLVENGCNNIQGYYYSKPVPTEEMEVILKNGLQIS